MTQPLASVAISGFRSIDRLHLDLSSEITLLVGANGSGKSNIVDALELLGCTVDQRLQGYVARHPFSQMLHRSTDGLATERIAFDVWGGWTEHFQSGGRVRNGYRMQLTAGRDDTAVLTETVRVHRDDHPEPYDRSLGSCSESALAEAASARKANNYLLQVLSGCRVFHFDDTSIDAPPLRSVDVGDSLTLHDDARNLAAVLLDMRIHHSAGYLRVLRSVRAVAPFFDDFVLEPRGDQVILRWRERGLDDVFSGSALSSGTLRFICLATLLQQSTIPATIVLDEPELGLHPAAIHQLAALLRTAASGRRILAATQSVTLLSQFSVDEIAVVERVHGATTVERPDPRTLESWLADYTVGDLWQMNLLGGQPRPADAPRRT